MSASRAYRPPEVKVKTYEGKTYGERERRSQEPVNQLGRRLDTLCLEASDSFEIAAHLEALGYNGDDVPARYGVLDHFELAERLFVATPKFLPLEQPAARPASSLSKQLVMVLTLLVASSIGLLTEVSAWSAVFWLLIWSQVGGALLSRAGGELDTPKQARVMSLVLELGIIGMVVAWFFTPFALATWTVSLLWVGVAGLLWDERLGYARFLPLAAAVLLLLHVWAGVDLTFMLAGMGLVTLVALRPLLVWSTPDAWRWTLQQGKYLLPFALYGVGQGLLLLALLRGARLEALPGVALFAIILLSAESHLLYLRSKLKSYLWQEGSTRRYAVLSQRAVVGYAGRYLFAFVPALALWLTLGAHPSLFYLWGFALFGLALALGLVFLSLGDSILPAAAFLVGGTLVSLGLPFWFVLPLLIAAEFALLLRRCRDLGRHGIHLL